MNLKKCGFHRRARYSLHVATPPSTKILKTGCPIIKLQYNIISYFLENMSTQWILCSKMERAVKNIT